MQGRAGLLWLLLLCLVCNSAEKLCRHDRFRMKTHGTKKFCDPSFSTQTAGAVTQTCSSGSYRERAGPSRGRCVPCSCNGLSEECDEQTGTCVNCRSDASGPRCERCRDGYYGNAADGTCRPCPCPFTWNSFAAACLDVGSGSVECLCKRGYSGARCDRCAFGYFGNPLVPGGNCKPCNCKNGLNTCDSLTGECITPGTSSCGVHCHDCSSCSVSLLLHLEETDDVFARLKLQLQDGSNSSGSRLSVSETELLQTEQRTQLPVTETTKNLLKNVFWMLEEFKTVVVRRFVAALRRLDMKAEQLETDVDISGNDLSQLTEKTLTAEEDLRRILQEVNETKLKAADLQSAAEALLTAAHDVLTRRIELQPTELLSLSEDLQEAERRLQETRGSCSAQRDAADTERQLAHRVLDAIRNDTSDPEDVLNAAADSLMSSGVCLGAAAALLSGAAGRVLGAQNLNLQRLNALQHLERLHIQLQTEQRTQLPETETTKNLLKNTTTVFWMLEEIKTDFERLAAQLDGANLQLFNKLNNIFMRKVDVVSRAEQHAEELDRHTTELQQALRNATNSTNLLSEGALNNIIDVVEKAETAANQSRETAEQNLKDMKELRSAEGLKENSSRLQTDADAPQRDLTELSHAVSTVRDRLEEQKEKGESVRARLSAVTDIRNISRGDSDVLIQSAKTAASASNSTVQTITDRLTIISHNVERITLRTDDTLADAERTLQDLNAALPVLRHRLTRVEALGGRTRPAANTTESIRRIKDVIEETRNFVNSIPLATAFNGKGHVELRPPRNLEDLQNISDSRNNTSCREHSFIPADLSSLPQTGRCRLRPPDPSRLRPPEPSGLQRHEPIKAPAGRQCERRRARRGEQQLSEEHSWLSYSVPQQDLNHRPHFSLDIKTKTSKGLILHVAGRGVVPLLALYVANGKIRMSLGRNRIIQHKQRSNDGHWHRVEFSVEKSTFHLLVDGIRVTDGLLPNAEGSSLDLHGPVNLGGDPTSRTTKGHNIPSNSIIGCFRDFKMNEVSVGEPEETHRTSPCADWLTETGTHFGGGHIVFESYFSLGSQFVLVLELRPQYLTGLLLHVQSHESSLSVFLLENKVVVSVNDGLGVVSVSAAPPESLCDGKFHMVTVSKQRDAITLVLDSTSEQSAAAFTSTSTALETLYIGGGTERSRAPVLSPFVGCLRNVKLNGRSVEFEAASRLVDPVSINRCPG